MTPEKKINGRRAGFCVIRRRAFKLTICSLGFALALGLGACGGGSGSTNHPPLGSMAGSWDFTVIPSQNPHPVVLEKILTQDNSGNISGTGTATANGPAGNNFKADLSGSSLSNAADISVDYLGDTCAGIDSGTRTLAGTINSSNQVTMTIDVGGVLTVSISGTLNPSATPPFSGTLTTSGPCGNGANSPITGTLATPLTGAYSGTSAANNTETIALDLTDTSGSLSGNGTDGVTGNFTMTGTTVGNAFSATVTPTPSVGGSLFGYFDPQLGSKGSILLTSFQGGNASSCPNGVPIDNGSCLIAILAMQ